MPLFRIHQYSEFFCLKTGQQLEVVTYRQRTMNTYKSVEKIHLVGASGLCLVSTLMFKICKSYEMPCAKASPIFMLFDFTEISKSSRVVVQQAALMFGFPLFQTQRFKP